MDILWQDTPKNCRAFTISNHTFDIIAKDDLTMSKWYRLASDLAQFQLMIIIYYEISYGVNQIYSGHNCLAIPVYTPQFFNPDATHSDK